MNSGNIAMCRCPICKMVYPLIAFCKFCPTRTCYDCSRRTKQICKNTSQLHNFIII